MKLIIDVMGGDNAPDAVLEACAAARDEFPEVEFILVGKSDVIKQRTEALGIAPKLSGCTVEDAPDEITMCDEPISVRHKKDSSMAVALRLLKEGQGDALVSAGNTGALLVGATLFVRCIDGIKRAALCPMFPTKTGKMMIVDSGANLDCKPEMLNQFAVMGSEYMRCMEGLESPRVGLANNGEEETKGPELYVEAYKLLKANKNINFIGNVEGRGVMMGQCDVLVCDGFTGNLILKSCEGTGLLFIGELKDIFYKNLITKLGAALVYKGLKQFKKRMDYKEIGGAVLLGIRKPVVKAHGSSDARAYRSAIRQAVNFARAGVIDRISAVAATLSDAGKAE